MPPTERKFLLSRIVVSAVVFISLYVSTDAEIRRCYWCGPLADQVHRSQRPPVCSNLHSIADCDPGFPYCAVVATSPPYIESRYCVKLYQDECYPLYCNSTRTWRMTCPCRGDFCNGPNTERELDAFAGLAKLVARTQNTRHKRALINKAGFLSLNTNRQNRIDNTTVENDNTPNNLTDKEANENQINDTNTSMEADNKDMDNQSDTTTVSVPPDVKENEVVGSTTVANADPKNSESATNSPSDVTTEIIKTSDSHMNLTSIQIDIPSTNIESSDLKTEIIIMSSETTKLFNDTKLQDLPNTNVNVPDVASSPQVITQAAIEPKTMVETTTEATKTTPSEGKTVDKQKPSEPLATVATIQHDTTVAKTTPNLKAISTVNPQNSTAVRIDAHILTLAVSIVLNYKI